MAVNITCTGDIYDGAGVMFTGAEVHYQVYFYKVNVSSSASKWSDPRLSILGQYNFNLADSDLLTTAGSASSGDKVVVVFWTGLTTNRNDTCSLINEWGAFEIILGTGPGMLSADTYVNPAQIKPNIDPILNWSLPSTGYVGVSYTATNNSYDTHDWYYNDTHMYHWYTKYSQVVHSINQINNSDYYWDDGFSDEGVEGTSSRSHSWAVAGSYDVRLVIEDECVATVTGTKTINIYNNAPVPNIICHQASGQNIINPNTIVTFEYSGTDPDNQIISIDWVINDAVNTVSNGLVKNSIISHSSGEGTSWYGQSANSGAFTNPGTHNVSIVVHWFDGFSAQTISYNENFYQLKFSGPNVDFTQYPAEATVSSGVRFTNISTNTYRVGTGLPDGTQYDWIWVDNSVTEDIINESYSYELEKTPASADCSVSLCANWNDGWENQVSCVEKEVVFSPYLTISEEDCYYNMNIVGTSSDGTVTGYHWEIYNSTVSGIDTWELIWTSPVGLEQNNKKICFTSVGNYRIIGYIHGSGDTVSSYTNIFIDEVCPTGDIIYVNVPSTPPIVRTEKIGNLSTEVLDLKPSIKVLNTSIQTSSDRVLKRGIFPFPKPINL